MTHFQNEERFFKQSSFGMPADEIRRHEQGITVRSSNSTQRFVLISCNESAMGRSEALEMVEHWIAGHVVHHDLRLRDYLDGTAARPRRPLNALTGPYPVARP